MRVRLGSLARQEVRALPPGPKSAIRQALTLLEQDGVGATIDLRRLSVDSGPPVYRIRVGTWRVVFLMADGEAQALRVFPRREGYAWLER